MTALGRTTTKSATIIILPRAISRTTRISISISSRSSAYKPAATIAPNWKAVSTYITTSIPTIIGRIRPTTYKKVGKFIASTIPRWYAPPPRTSIITSTTPIHIIIYGITSSGRTTMLITIHKTTLPTCISSVIAPRIRTAVTINTIVYCKILSGYGSKEKEGKENTKTK